MREQVATPVFSPSIERKKTSINLSRRDENHDNNRRRLGGGGGGYLGYLKSIVHMPGERLRGGSSILHNRDQEVDNHVAEPASREKMLKSEAESERAKRKAWDDSVVLLHWGHKKRPRCNRVDAKHGTDESSVQQQQQSKSSTIRVERRVVKAEREEATTVVVQQQAIAAAKGLQQQVQSQQKPQGANEAAAAAATGTARRSSSSSTIAPELPPPDKLPPQTSSSPAQPCSFTPAQNGSDAAPKADLDLLEWPRILLSMSRKEKEDDFLSIKGTKLPQRPKRRPKAVEKALHYCSPGTWLSDLTRGRYDVREKKSVKKTPRGLKAMESMDSDSD